jgi:hypothetical protein
VYSKVAIAMSHPDQWGFWEWLGQTPRLVQVPKLSYYYYCYYYCSILTPSDLCEPSAIVLAGKGERNANSMGVYVLDGCKSARLRLLLAIVPVDAMAQVS